MVSVFFSCADTAPTREIQLLDSLNTLAYNWRYRNIDSSYQYAATAYKRASGYNLGKAEAMNHLGFYYFMKMDFETAEKIFSSLDSRTPNELELLIADIGLMKIYQRTSMNKEFYDARNRALRRMRRIDEDSNLFVDVHEKRRLATALLEFRLTSATYFLYLQQRLEALESLEPLERMESLYADTTQLLTFMYLKGSFGISQATSREEQVTDDFDQLFRTWRTAREGNYLYFEALALQGMAELLLETGNLEIISMRRSQALRMLNIPDGEQVIPVLSGRALHKFKAYNDIYRIAGTYVTIGKYLNKGGNYEAALDTLKKALEYVNYHHSLYYTADHTPLDTLTADARTDTLATELQWITTEGIKTVPEWIAQIREQLSVSYAGLELLPESNYNRNIYLDILDFTRQNKEWESRYLALQKESRQLNYIIFLVIGGFILLFPFFWLVNVRSKERNEKYMEHLRLTLEICHQITASLSTEVGSEEDIVDKITATILPGMRKLLGINTLNILLNDPDNGIVRQEYEGIRSEIPLKVPDREEAIATLQLYSDHKLTKENHALVKVIAPYIAWTIDNGLAFLSLREEQEKLDKQRYIHEKHIAENKRQNILKKACLAIVNGINPFIDRILHETGKLHALLGENKQETRAVAGKKYEYIDELVTKINEYNDILALWIKMKQGTLNLNVENFELDELFELLAKGRKTFEMKGQHFKVTASDAIVKADKALTLFMLNTLTENARKYTREGGTIQVYAEKTSRYVEISVEDTGIGLSEEDIQHIIGEKVYDSSTIGSRDNENAGLLRENKGSGFGLMNCKGIIEKYRKSNELFRVCTYNIESTPGKGSRFYFRLPVGIKKIVWALVLLLTLPALQAAVSEQTRDTIAVPPSLTEVEDEFVTLLEQASYLADSAYYCNIRQEFEEAVFYVDSAIYLLNLHYDKFEPSPEFFLQLYGEDTPTELYWWNNNVITDYHVILDIRNEAAVAFLALKEWDAYSYNNTAYTGLYKLISEDYSLEEYCKTLQNSTNNKIVGIILCGLLVVALFFIYYILYVRKRLTNRMNLEQVLDINRHIFASSLVRPADQRVQQQELPEITIPQRIIDETFESFNELFTIDALYIAVKNEESNRMEFASNPFREDIPKAITECFRQERYVVKADIHAFPLTVENQEREKCIGVFAVRKKEAGERECLLMELIARYIAIVVFNAVIKIALKYRDIEEAHEDNRRASWEDGIIHVQNMVLDNCLSTIKHETIYYPNKIKQIVDKLKAGSRTPEVEKEYVHTLGELAGYYKGIYTILSSCAARQLEEVTFRRTSLTVNSLFEYAQRYFKKVTRGSSGTITLVTEEVDFRVTGDRTQLEFLLENLINESLDHPEKGVLHLTASRDGAYIRFDFTDTRIQKSREELNELFYPNLKRMGTDSKGRLTGIEYLVCKQIIREHDEFAGKRGCRINAEPGPKGGFTVYFTIPERKRV